MSRLRTGGGIYDAECALHGGRSCWRIRFYDDRGRRRQVTHHGITKTEARALWMQQQREHVQLAAGLDVRAERVTLREYWRIFEDEVERGRHAPSTVKKMQEHARHFLKGLGHLKLAELDDEAVSKARREWRQRAKYEGDPAAGRPLSAGTEWAVDKTLTAVVHHAARSGYFGAEAARLANMKKPQWVKPWRSPERPKAAEHLVLETHEEIAALMRAAHEVGGLYLAAAVALMVAAGQRRGEQAGLTLRDLRRTKEGALQVKTKQPKTGRVVYAAVKGHFQALIEAYLDEHAETWPDAEMLFPRRTARLHHWEAGSERLGYVVDDASWRAIKERAGLPPALTVHGLRHTFARFLDEEGVSERAIQDVLGHSSRETTRRYTYREGREAADKVADAIGQIQLPFLALDAGEEVAE